MHEALQKVLNNSQLDPALSIEIATIGRLKKVKAGSVVISPVSDSMEIPIVLDGLLKVMREDTNGNEVFLYFLEGGETCAMSITCCIEGRKKAFKVMAEEDAVLWMVPMNQIDNWVAKYQSFRKFVFDAYQTRFDELLNAIDSVVFLKMDQRLYKYLLDKKQASGSYVIHKTHEQIANELNTSRVVVSRLLKQLEHEDKIEQHRNRIEIL
ncbi:MAG: Crp/Fnr family transcriptional regulator [Marinoscillum sp.]